jgi:hypothetical protein
MQKAGTSFSAEAAINGFDSAMKKMGFVINM